ncbi:hypothetical protein J4732_19710 [Serratia marcescens]|uniref:Uncharacterized protein n=1 Tax=Serratia marcescens TaxID=615 RepID=A0A939NMQ2_SERMA|nr:hypothetical protein [Serratia marcescens]
MQQVIDRHDILRTRSSRRACPRRQVVWRKAELSLRELRLNPAEGEIGSRRLTAVFDPRRVRPDRAHRC